MTAGLSSGEFAHAALSHADALYNFARWLAGDPTEAEDLVQETFVRALDARATFEAGTNLKAWLFRILRNLHADLRRRRRSRPTDPSDELETLPDPRSLLRDDLEVDRLRAIVAEQITEALFSLAPEARAVILLELEGLTEKEMADVLGCAQGTVKSRLSRARSALRVRLQEYAR